MVEMECERCGTSFEAKGEWQIYCIDCFKLIKKEELNNLKGEIEFLNNKVRRLENTTIRENTFDEEFLYDLIKLCHPDKHDNSPLSNDITSELLKMRKPKK